MDLFKFTNPTHEMRMEGGVFLPKFQEVTWTERYRAAGEITIKSKIEDKIEGILPIGTFVSHVDSDRIMRIDSHNPSESDGEPGVVTTIGSSFETFLDQRVVGSNHVFPTGTALGEFVLNEAPTGKQAARLIEYHLLPTETVYSADALRYVSVRNLVYGPQVTERRVVPRGSLYTAVIDILTLDNLGIRVLRPYSGQENVTFEVYVGRNKTNVVFGINDDELGSVESLRTDKGEKNCALVVGKWLDVMVDPYQKRGLQRKMMIVDGNDIDSAQETFPTGLALTMIRSAMMARGREALAKQKATAITQATASPTQPGTTYGVDYTVGDIVTVAGTSVAPSPMRVVEYVRIQDNEGEQGYPSFEQVEETT